MPSLITPQPKDTRKQTTVSLSGSVLAELELYCRFIESGRDWVINEALKSIFQKDKVFLEWKEQRALPSKAVTPSAASVGPGRLPAATSPTEESKHSSS